MESRNVRKSLMKQSLEWSQEGEKRSYRILDREVEIVFFGPNLFQMNVFSSIDVTIIVQKKRQFVFWNNNVIFKNKIDSWTMYVRKMNGQVKRKISKVDCGVMTIVILVIIIVIIIIILFVWLFILIRWMEEGYWQSEQKHYYHFRSLFLF